MSIIGYKASILDRYRSWKKSNFPHLHFSIIERAMFRYIFIWGWIIKILLICLLPIWVFPYFIIRCIIDKTKDNNRKKSMDEYNKLAMEYVSKHIP